MGRGSLRFFVSLLLVGCALAVVFAVAPPAGAVPPSISSLRTDGHTLVWMYNYYSSSLVVQTIGDPHVRTPAENVTSPDVSGNLVVWEVPDVNGSKLAGMNLADGSALTMPTPLGHQMKPSLSGSRLVWVNDDTSVNPPVWSIMTADLSTATQPQVVATLPGGGSEAGRPEISGNLVVWSLQYGGQGSSNAHWELWATTIGQPPHVVANGYGATDNLIGYDVGGASVVYADSGNVHLLDANVAGSDRVIGSGFFPTTDGRYVFWNEPPVQVQMSLGAYDIQSHSSFDAVANGNVNSSPWARGGVLAWVWSAPYSSSLNVDAHNIHDLLPSAARPNPGNTNPNWTYYAATGHYLASGFRTFWTRSGGLPVFGYPLTEEFSQAGFTVQYLERQRFEYHPEYANTPYETELGLLGAEAAASAGLLTQPAFARLPLSTPSDANCTFMPSTGHRLCFGFRQYWQSHGLDFGDPGTSFRESLALFGYPISEEFTDPSTGITVQYFERAVFEYHPNNPDPYKIELRRLGADRLQSMGW